jgi:RNA polymerase sigma-70 factor (ECF subfamily)
MLPHEDADFEALYAAARRQFPSVEVERAAFAAYVRERREGADEALSDHGAAQLYFACACVRGDREALRLFEQTCVPVLERAIAKARLSVDAAADVVQSLRTALLVGDGERRPKLAEFRGEGELAGWLRVTATRAALKVARKGKREVEADDVLLAERSTGDDPELAYLKEVYRDAFRVAFASALAGLDARTRTMLKQHWVDGLTIDRLGELYGVHRATAARWLQKGREDLLAATLKDFRARTRLSTRECDSVLRMVQSRLEVTFRRLLA